MKLLASMISSSSNKGRKFMLMGLGRYCDFVRSTSGSVKQWDDLYSTDPINVNEATFGKVLISNRGEIACRIIRTCRKMGIKTVAVHSKMDSKSLFVKMADESIDIGNAPARESYLVMEKILSAVRTTGADAVHPGYGFLSENTLFVSELEKANVTFIGPNSRAIKGMGDKIASKRLAIEAGVNGILGFDGVIESAEHCVQLSKDIGYPVMIKASAGGGGKGMRIAFNDKEAKEYFRLCSEEGAASFGDNRLLVEKYVESPRHIEIQILSDKHGNVIHLFERECSIQRRNQKVIEEAPSSFLDEITRKRMGEQAVALAKAINYDSAGTVEFLVDKNKKFYFLEMNTRIQVEHPITECITGVDLIQQMIRIAYGHRLNLTQDQIKIKRWSVESRVYAEDPFKNFGMPAAGRLYRYAEPLHLMGVRCDSGIEEGSEISMYYDPMICKLTTYGKNRAEAIGRCVDALDQYVIRGVTHNIPLLRNILEESEFLAGNFTTDYLTLTYPEGFHGHKLNRDEVIELVSVAGVMYVKEEYRRRASSVVSQADIINKLFASIQLSSGEVAEFHIVISRDEKSLSYLVSSDSWQKIILDNFQLSDDVIFPTSSISMQLMPSPNCTTFRIIFKGTPFDIEVVPFSVGKLRSFMKKKKVGQQSKAIISPMPGLVKNVSVFKNESVVEGQIVCVIEAMKMQNDIKSVVSGKIENVLIKEGDVVEEDQIIIQLS